jgi:hypothetical protein
MSLPAEEVYEATFKASVIYMVSNLTPHWGICWIDRLSSLTADAANYADRL